MHPATTATSTRNRRGRGDVLVDARWLEDHLDDPAVRVVEVDVKALAFDDGHIPGAVLWNVYRDLKDTEYRLADDEAVEELLARSGISRESTVVCYGYAPAMAFWLLTLYRHRDVRILDCSRDAWRDERRPWTTKTTEPAPPVCSDYQLPGQDLQVRVDQAAVLAAIDDHETTVLDVRTVAEFRGERFWPSGGSEPGGRAGHVPAAVNLSLDDVHDKDGRFGSALQLTDVFAPAELSPNDEVIAYCTIGGRACTAWFALTYLLGYERVRVYDGSWAEWGRQPATPIETLITAHSEATEPDPR